tara:strand:+ start:62 stop:391 length:330 start_codon:yes stop_codon:yes gene_type:complete
MGQQNLMHILREKCDPKEALEKNLPYTSYLVEYTDKENLVCYDIVVSQKQTEIFDHYWDNYKSGLKRFHQTEGNVDPRRWVDPKKPVATPPTKRKKRKKPEPPEGADAA